MHVIGHHDWAFWWSPDRFVLSRAPGGRVTRWSVGVMRRLGVDGDLDVIVFMGPSGRQDKSKE